jgi:hypothetical protein
MAPRFEDLPAELLVNITAHITTIDYGSVRRTCSTVEKKLFDSFGKEFFKRKQFMLTQSSLQALIDISNHEALRGYMTKVIIGTNFIPDYRHSQGPNMLHPYALGSAATLTTDDPETRAWHRAQYLEQRYLISQGLDTTMLTEALNNLPSCHEIEIRDSYCPVRGRGDERWTSYGSTDFLKRFGQMKWLWWSEQDQYNRSNHVFSTVTRAMAATAHAKKFTAFMMTTRNFQNDLADDAFFQSNLVNYTDAFKSITTLMLPLYTRPDNPDLADFCSFLRLCPGLTNLRLNGTPNTDASKWLLAAKDAVASCSIRRLDLGKMRVLPDVFKDFLSSLKGLEHLKLHWVSDARVSTLCGQAIAPPSPRFRQACRTSRMLWKILICHHTFKSVSIPNLYLD